MRRSLFAATVIAMAAGCARTPVPAYYTLDMSEASTPAAPLKWRANIERVHMTQALARPEILIKKSPTEVEYYALARWVGDLDALVTEKLELEWSNSAPDARPLELAVHLLAFEQLDTAEGAVAHAKLRVAFYPDGMGLGDQPAAVRSYEARIAASAPAPGPVVEALSEALDQVAAQIAADFARL
ncbi:MAG: hypothetical protein GY851_25505 [bacterium]|nr:hypothetical protein [bacterium]